MNNKKLIKSLIGVFTFILVIIGLFYTNVVKAEESKKATTKTCQLALDQLNITDKYGVTLAEAADENYVLLKVKPVDTNNSSRQAKLRKVVFYLIKKNGVAYTGPEVKISYNGNTSGLKLKKSDYMSNGSMDLIFASKVDTPDPDHPECTDQFFFEVGLEGGGPIVFEDIDVIIPNPSDDASLSSGIGIDKVDCDNQKTDFDKKFCYAKSHITSGFDFTSKFDSDSENYKKYKDIIGENVFQKFKCDGSKVYTEADLKTDTTVEDNYYTTENTKYMFGSGTFNITNGHYKYRYVPEYQTIGEEVKCTIKCEEAVTVQYGLPVATKAGLCFEYKVKVTSRVSCDMVAEPNKYKTNQKKCYPTPWCYHEGKWYNQAGPNDDFDACVKSCDGGKYTKKCSNSCYNKIYGNALSLSYNASNTSYVASEITDPDDVCTKKAHYTISGGDSGSVRFPYKRAGWWYGSDTKSGYAVLESDGFFRRVKGGGDYCHDKCHWSGCTNPGGDGYYLEPSCKQGDIDYNNKIYEDTIKKCKSAAKCSTSQATFTIKVSYNDGNNQVQTIEYPYSKQIDRTCSRHPDNSSSCSATTSNRNTTIYQFGGCYNSSSTENRAYMTEWGFPGVWLNAKTGEISFEDMCKNTTSGNCTWKPINKKFCLPLDAKNHNPEYWSYYTATVAQREGKTIESIDYTDGDNVCHRYTVNRSGSKIIYHGETLEDYNIEAETKDFGYFGWNINIKCFYSALNPGTYTVNYPGDSDSSVNCRKTSDGDAPYTIRTIDLEDVFPSTQGNSISTPSDTGRTPGYNWTAKSAETLKNNKTGTTVNDFLSYPDKYTQYVQSRGYSIYNDVPDYEFYLSPETLKSLRGSAEKKYNEYNNGSMQEVNGILRYRSNIISDLISSSSSRDLVIGCNNIDGNTCQDAQKTN